MDHWRSVLPSAHFSKVDYEVLVADPAQCIPWLVTGCGLDWNDACLVPHNNSRTIATASRSTKTPLRVGDRYEPWLGELRDLVTELAHNLMDIDSRYVAEPGQHSTQGTGTPMDLSLACARLARALRPSR
jgi:hypothetical protein